MQTRQGRVLQSLRTVQAFLDINAERLPGIATSGARRKLDDVVTAITQQMTDQSGSNLAAQGSTQKHRSLRQALRRDHMAPIAKIAASELPATPEMEPLKLPRGQPTPERLQAHALGMAKAAEPYSSIFIASGLPDDFIAQLVAAADTMVGEIKARGQSKIVQRTATRGLRDLFSAGRKAVHALDALVQSALKDDSARLAGWNSAKRVQLVAIPAAPSGSTVEPEPTEPTAPAAPIEPAPVHDASTTA